MPIEALNVLCAQLTRNQLVIAKFLFKVVQQQTTGKVGNSIMCLWTDNFCLQQ